MEREQVAQGELPLQEIFARVWLHFVAGKGEASLDGSKCKYRRNGMASDPVRCAIGVFIPDAEYDPSMDGYDSGLSVVIRHSPTLRRLLGEERYEVLSKLQMVHDNAALAAVESLEGEDQGFHALIETGLRQFALRYALSIPGE